MKDRDEMKNQDQHQIWVIHNEELEKDSSLRHIALWVDEFGRVARTLQSCASIDLARDVEKRWGVDLKEGYETVESWGEGCRCVHVEKVKVVGGEVWSRDKLRVPKTALPVKAWDELMRRGENGMMSSGELHTAFVDMAYAPTMDCWMFPWAGMWLGVERDGHVHS